MSGNRLIIVPGHFIRRTSRLTPNTARKTEIELRLSVEEKDSVFLQLPPGYTPEHLPSGHLTYPFGSYTVTSSFEHDLLVLSCHYVER